MLFDFHNTLAEYNKLNLKILNMEKPHLTISMPNTCSLKAKIVTVNKNYNKNGQLLLRIKIIESKNIEGPNPTFA